MYDNLLDYAHRKLMELDRKTERGEPIEDYELQCGDLLAHMEKSLLTSRAMYEAGGTGTRGGMSFADGRGMGSNSYGMAYGDVRSYAMPMSYDDGRGMNRSGMGGGYSSADRMSDAMRSVREAMTTMPEHVRQEAQHFLTSMQQAQMR